VEDYEAVEEGVVVAECLGDLGPACGGDRGAVKEGWELVERVADVSTVGGWRRAKTGKVFFGLGGGKDW